MTFRLRFELDELSLRKTQTVVGRDDGCDITIDDDLVSRSHALLVLGDDGVEVVDLGSRNGTSVNGVKIDAPTRLKHGDRIRIGPREIVFVDAREDTRGPDSAYPTGKLELCPTCDEAYPAEAPACPRCGT